MPDLIDAARPDENGVLRVGRSQVLLDVYTVIAGYLRHRGQVDEYLRGRREQAGRLRQEIEAARQRTPPTDDVE